MPTTTISSKTTLIHAVRDLVNIQEAHKRYAISLLDNGRYPRENRIGEGANSSVFLGEAVIRGQRMEVAIKIARSPKDHPVGPRLRVTRLLREVLAWRNLNHRNVATFLGLDFSEACIEQLVSMDTTDCDSGPGRELRIPGLVSPYLKFGVLEYIARYPNMREACVINLVRGLTYLHKNYVIHGDLRPENIRVDHNGVLKLIDFGFSKLHYCSGFTTRTYSNLDPRFTAPELLLSPNGVSRPTFYSDVYSFSMCMLQLLSHIDEKDSSTPFRHIQGEWKLALAICNHHERPKRESYSNYLSDQQWSLMNKCWDQDRETRPTAHKVFETLSGKQCRNARDKCWL